MKVLMFGWEFPPFTSGGLGTACHGLTKGLCHHGVDVTFVVPRGKGDPNSSHVNMIFANELSKKGSFAIKEIDSPLLPYMDSKSYARIWYNNPEVEEEYDVYGKNLYEEVQRFAQQADKIDCDDYDIIHAHDWMTYPAAIRAKERTGKPLVLHIHATEFDRTTGSPNQKIYDIERQGFEAADVILAVSELTRQKVIQQYCIPKEKVQVVHNAIEISADSVSQKVGCSKDKMILFLGRITIQKGPEHFVWAAKKVAEVEHNVRFVVAGSGDMESRMVDVAADLGIADKFVFTGFLRGPDVDRAFKMADLYVMPSISEPFGLTPLEAMRNGTPALISKQSGCSEVLKHCLKVDFWDIDQMANKMVSVLRYNELYSTLSEEGTKEVQRFNWVIPAEKCVKIYSSYI
ncbi:MAG: glycosyltransferase family 4 protein [Candidatus Woesearchaeota archaeon]